MIARVAIDINGTAINHFDNVSISQPFDDHHTMSVRVGTADINEVLGMDGSGSSVNLNRLTQDWAGKKISITISQGETDLSGTLSAVANQVFEGLVSKLSFQMQDSVNSSVVITAVSPTFLLESGENTFSFVDLPLSEIIKKVFTPLRSKGWPTAVSPTNNPTIPYVTSYRETFYHFAQRLAMQFGEWFFYDGTKLVFGKSGAPTAPAVALEYGSNLLDMSYETRLVDLSTQSRIYDYENDDIYSYATTGNEVTAQNVAQQALRASLDILVSQNVDLSHQHHLTSATHEAAVISPLRMASNQLAVLAGTSTSLGMGPGRVISVNDNVQVNGVTIRTDTYGDFLLTKVYHYVDANGRYQNTFEAIPGNPDFPPVSYSKVVVPIAENQHAVVKETNDPQAMGRVKIKFPWHLSGTTTPWIRVANPMSGNETGVYFVPEIEEMVFVDFDFGDPDMPFVRGGFFHKNHKPGPLLFEQNNNFKGFITKGGNHILIDDTSGKENIKIYNKESKNELVLSLDGGSHIHIKSNGKIKMDADSIEMNADNITVRAREDFKLTSKNTSLLSDYSTTIWSTNSTIGIGSDADEVTMFSPTEVRLMSDQSIKLESGMDLALEATVGLKATGKQVAIEGSAMVEVKSDMMANVDGGQMMVVKGQFVMIN